METTMETTMDVTGGEPPLTLCALPDALLLHILAYLPRAELGAAGRVAKRLQTLATDDEVWRSECVSSFGLAVREDEHGQECHTFYEAARQWSRFARETIGVASTKKLPTLASDWRMAQEAWGRVARWAGKELPEAWASLGPPATPAEWATLQRRLKLEATPETSAALLALRLLSAVHDGQRIASDAAFILDAADFDDADADELIEALSRASGRAVGGRSRSGVQKWYASPAKHDDTIGLGGGFSAYEELACVRVLPVLLIEAYTTLVREKCSFPEHVLIVGASQNMSRVLAYDLETGELFLGPAGQSGPLSGRTRKRMGKLAMLPVCPLGHASRGRDVLLWMNELGCRLEGGMYLATPLLPPHESTRGLCLFPQNGPQFVSQVTRGIRVTASAVFAPERGTYVYSIRLLLLSPGEEGYMSAEERGFETAQLNTRHWVLRQASDPPNEVHGAGVIGLFPLLREGGWRNDRQTDASGRVRPGEELRGIFAYQSLSGQGTSISFEGHIDFVPGSLQQPLGDEFAVAVPRFPLSVGADDFLF